MKEKLIELIENSYSPYSNYKVAAIVVMKDGNEFKGVNVENASYGLAICAERNAIFNAISNGYKKNDFEKLYVMTCGPKIGMPCFACRQVIVEFFENEKEVICMDKEGNQIKHTVLEMCPYPFSDEDLK